VGEEPNHRTASKPGPLKMIQYSLVLVTTTGTSFIMQGCNTVHRKKGCATFTCPAGIYCNLPNSFYDGIVQLFSFRVSLVSEIPAVGRECH
jgi:hypothetical protein